MEIVNIEPRWNERYANDPDIEITVDELLPNESFVYERYPSDPSYGMLISTNNAPWVRFVYINDPTGSPTRHGALGGTYKLTDGTVFESRTGWSSREGIINTRYRHAIEDEIVYPTIRVGTNGGLWAGYYIYKDALRNHPLWPKDCYLVRHTKFVTDEIYWTISTDPNEVRKP